MNHEYFMREALKEARRSFEEGDVPVGAVIVHEKKIIARAHNQVELLTDPTAHAEMLAITQASAALNTKWLHKATVYVTLEPCAMCAGAFVLARVPTVLYAAPDPKSGACGSVFNIAADDRLNHRIKIIHDILRDEAEALLRDFFRNLRKERR